MSHVLRVVLILLALSQVFSYGCRRGKCDGGDTCCNVRSLYGKCCQQSAKCCYHGPWTGCCGPLDTCCWGVHYRGISCCPPRFRCCGVGRYRRRAGCCFKTPIWIWILIGICGSIILLLLILSLYQCINEQIEEYERQQGDGSLPSNHAWYYYDYGSGARYRPTPPAYDNDPPPSYSRNTNPAAAGNTNNTNSNSRNSNSNNNNSNSRSNNNRPKPPTPNSRQNRQGLVESETQSEHHSEYHSALSSYRTSNSSLSVSPHSDPSNTFPAPTPEETTSESGGELDGDTQVMHTLYSHPVPKLQRMLCTSHKCMVRDGSCVYCMDRNENKGAESEEEILKSDNLQKIGDTPSLELRHSIT